MSSELELVHTHNQIYICSHRHPKVTQSEEAKKQPMLFLLENILLENKYLLEQQLRVIWMWSYGLKILAPKFSPLFTVTSNLLSLRKIRFPLGQCCLLIRVCIVLIGWLHSASEVTQAPVHLPWSGASEHSQLPAFSSPLKLLQTLTTWHLSIERIWWQDFPLHRSFSPSLGRCSWNGINISLFVNDNF